MSLVVSNLKFHFIPLLGFVVACWISCWLSALLLLSVVEFGGGSSGHVARHSAAFSS